jgi:hypothetical protein
MEDKMLNWFLEIEPIFDRWAPMVIIVELFVLSTWVILKQAHKIELLKLQLEQATKPLIQPDYQNSPSSEPPDQKENLNNNVHQH